MHTKLKMVMGTYQVLDESSVIFSMVIISIKRKLRLLEDEQLS